MHLVLDKTKALVVPGLIVVIHHAVLDTVQARWFYRLGIGEFCRQQLVKVHLPMLLGSPLHLFITWQLLLVYNLLFVRFVQAVDRL